MSEHQQAGLRGLNRLYKPFWSAAAVLLITGFCAVSGLMLLQLRHDAWDRAVTGAENLLEAASQDIERTIETYDLSLQAVAERFEHAELPGLSPELQNMVLFDQAASARNRGAILVLNEAGDVVRDMAAIPPRTGNLSDRDYFKAHRDHADLGLHISAPFVRRITGQGAAIALSRRLSHRDGSFAGVVVGTIGIEHFRDIFERADLGQKGSMNLFRTDGILLVRAPYDAAQIGQDLSGSSNVRRFVTERSGTFTGVAAIDGVLRIYSFTRIGSLPLTLNVALAESDVLAVWHSRAVVIGLALSALCALAAGMAWRLARMRRQRIAADEALRESEAQYRLLADHATDIILRLDHSLRHTFVSPSSLAVLGHTPSELLGRSPRELVHPDDWPRVEALLALPQDEAGRAEVTYRSRHKDGRYIWVEGRFSSVAKDGGLIVVLREVSARKEAEEKLEAANVALTRLASVDGLTGLANRRRFDEALNHEWLRGAREQTPLSLILLDVDRFKAFNDRYGHPAGDECLRAVASAVGAVPHRPGDLTARYGGEEMVLLLPNTEAFGAAFTAENVRVAVERLGLRHAGNEEGGGIVTVSVGCATIIPQPGQSSPTMADLVGEADRMLYAAKHAGRNRVVSSSIFPEGRGERTDASLQYAPPDHA